MPREVVLSLPFTGRWLVRNSPARRVPSHGTDLWGERYAIDFVGVDDRGRTARHRDWRTFLATEPPERFEGFGRPILAPAGGVIVGLSDGVFVAVVHLRQGSVRVTPGERVTAGQSLATCGNSGNSTQPHVHVQAMDSPGLTVARGLPMHFRDFREWPSGRDVRSGIPAESAIIEAVIPA